MELDRNATYDRNLDPDTLKSAEISLCLGDATLNAMDFIDIIDIPWFIDILRQQNPVKIEHKFEFSYGF